MSEGISQPDAPVAREGRAKGDLFAKFDDLIAMREGLLASGVEDPFNLVMEKVLSPTRAICNGRETILLGTYNYMGMTFDPDVVEAGKQALADFGSGTTGSRVLNGTYQGHKEVEQALMDFYAMNHAMVFSTGYQANLGIISTIAGKGDYIILDIDSHASIWDGCAMGNAEVVPFKHNDIEAMEKRLKRIPEGAGKLVVLEGVYSMLGDVAPLAEMVKVAKDNGAMVLVDEAHSMGFIGEHGRGDEYGLGADASYSVLEIADLFVVNKADRPGASDARRDLELMIDLSVITGRVGSVRPAVLMTTATESEGIEALAGAIDDHFRLLAGGSGLALQGDVARCCFIPATDDADQGPVDLFFG